MQNKVKYSIIKDSFSIANFPAHEKLEGQFIEVVEWSEKCVVYKWWNFKCLQLKTVYSSKESWVLEYISWLFSENRISIFVFTTIDNGYFFFEKSLLRQVERDILWKI